MILGSLLFSFFADGIFSPEFNALLSQVLTEILNFITTPYEFSWGQAFTIYFEGAALLIAILVIMANGIRSYFVEGNGASVVHYILHSIWPLAVIAAGPALFSFISGCVRHLITDLTPAAATLNFENVIKWFLDFQLYLSWINAIMLIVVLYYTTTVIFQCIKRQIQLVLLATIGPLVCAMSVSENNSGDVITIIKEMFGIGVITVLQLALLITAIQLPGSMILEAVPSIISPLVIIAFFSAVKNLPRWIERYTLAPTVSGGGGMRMAGMGAGYAGRALIGKAVQ